MIHVLQSMNFLVESTNSHCERVCIRLNADSAEPKRIRAKNIASGSAEESGKTKFSFEITLSLS